MWDLIVSVPDHCLSFYFKWTNINVKTLGIHHDYEIDQAAIW